MGLSSSPAGSDANTRQIPSESNGITEHPARVAENRLLQGKPHKRLVTRKSVRSEVFSVSSKGDTHKGAFSFTPALHYMKTTTALKGQWRILKGTRQRSQTPLQCRGLERVTGKETKTLLVKQSEK